MDQAGAAVQLLQALAMRRSFEVVRMTSHMYSKIILVVDDDEGAVTVTSNHRRQWWW